jgi:GT2 family glycosyltransferase
MPDVTVAIPVRDGGALFAQVLAALAQQTVAHELLICDTRSRDGSAQLARDHGARVLEIAPERFSHGGARNLLMANAKGDSVALLTQDSCPADARWLERLLGGLAAAEDVAIAYGPYLPRADAPAAVALELAAWFDSLAGEGGVQIERLGEHERALPAVDFVGRRGFFTDANACVSRAAWERVPFREVPYAEDRVLALEMLRAGYAKAYVPDAAVVHSHDYSPSQQLRRSFDEWRGLLEVYGWREPASPARELRLLRGDLAHARASLQREGVAPGKSLGTLAAVSRHHVASRAGALLGSRADGLPGWATRRLSLERRAGFQPLELGEATTPPPIHSSKK